VGCGDDETLLRPLDGGTPPAVEAGADAKPPPVDAGPPVRTVETRNPFGNTAVAKNLMVDGDFELTSGDGQFGWRAIGSAGAATLLRETGGLCRSGVTCAILTSDADLLGMAAAPKDQSMDITVWSKPPEADCGLTTVSVISCTTLFVSAVATVPPEKSEPDATGWCRHHAVAPPMTEGPCLFVESLLADGRILVDDVSIVPASGGSAGALAATVPSADQLGRMQRAVRTVIEQRRLGRAAPPAGE
jgi:hypothetical protein